MVMPLSLGGYYLIYIIYSLGYKLSSVVFCCTTATVLVLGLTTLPAYYVIYIIYKYNI